MAELTIEKARNAKRESKYIEFKEKIDLSQAGDWCEIVKDIVAIANSGGGFMIFGLKNNGTPSGWDPTSILSLDPAQLTDKIARYTGEQFSDFDILEMERDGKQLGVIAIHSASIPMVFTNPGTYDIGGGKQKTAFGRGTIYFRHGAKSELGTSKDIRDCIDREIEKVRKSWLGNIRKVVTAPTGYKVNVLPPEITESINPDAVPIRLVEDQQAPAYRKLNPDITHPHRLKELVQVINQKIQKKRISPHDIYCVRKVHKIDKTMAKFFHKPKFGSPQYSDLFAGWVIEQFEKDGAFFDKAREECRKKN